MRFEYRVLWVQQERVTFVDGAWQGTIPYEQAISLGPSWADTCELQYPVLNQMGEDGWELVTVVRDEGNKPYLRMYLKRSV